ncbi:hypothetical protein ABK040_012406 [Willaertia magna]
MALLVIQQRRLTIIQILVLALCFILSSSCISSSSSFNSVPTSVNSYLELEQYFNRVEQMNPNGQTKAFTAFVSCSFNEWKRNIDYLVGTFTLFQSIIENAKPAHALPSSNNDINTENQKETFNYNFILIMVPPKLDPSKGITEEKAVRKALQFISEVYRAKQNTPLEDKVRIFVSPYITNPTEGKHGSSSNTETRYIDTFNKLHIWNLDEFGYKKIIYFDADCFVLDTIQLELLFSCGHFCAVSDLVVTDYFNGGLMVIEPNHLTFNDMMKKVKDPAYLSYDGGEQGFINSYFDFRRNATFWRLEEELLQIENDPTLDRREKEEKKEALKLDYGNRKNVYRLPFKYNSQVPLFYVSKYAWYTKFKDNFVAIHMTLPIKPWSFVSFPMLDYSYLWYKYFRQINLYQFFPLDLALYNISLGLCCYLIFKIGIFVKLCNSFIGNDNWLQKSLEFKIYFFTLGKTNFESYSLIYCFTSLLLFTLPPILIVAINTTVVVFLFLLFLHFPTYDPHVVWNNMFVMITIFNTISFTIYNQFLQSLTLQFMRKQKMNEVEELREFLKLKASPLFIQKLILSPIGIIVGFNLLFLLFVVTYGQLTAHIAYLTVYSCVVLYFLLFHLLLPYSSQIIIRAVLNDNRPSHTKSVVSSPNNNNSSENELKELKESVV